MADNMNMDMDDLLGDLGDLLGDVNADIAKMDDVVLSQNLEGFAGKFPDWDLHPPVK